MSSEEGDSNRMAGALVNIEHQLLALSEGLTRYGEQHLGPPLPSPGILLVKFREPTEKEVVYGKSLVPMVEELDRGEIARQVLWRVLRDDPPWPLERVECSIVPAVGVTWLIVREGDVGYMVLDTKALSGEVLEYEFVLATVLRVEFLDPDKEGVGWIELRRISDSQALSYKLVVTGLGVVCE